MSVDKFDQNSKSHKRDPDLANAEIAMKRAAIKAREIAQKTGTAVVTLKNKVIREEYFKSATDRE
ncbi:MAG: hypothetical protein L3J70_10380 [Gammaproteobacteria bacterium]|nr:hypothetical protein [Gammaproteobacteria bacterium]